jgi:hypothetical protein
VLSQVITIIIAEHMSRTQIYFFLKRKTNFQTLWCNNDFLNLNIIENIFPPSCVVNIYQTLVLNVYNHQCIRVLGYFCHIHKDFWCILIWVFLSNNFFPEGYLKKSGYLLHLLYWCILHREKLNVYKTKGFFVSCL